MNTKQVLTDEQLEEQWGIYVKWRDRNGGTDTWGAWQAAVLSALAAQGEAQPVAYRLDADVAAHKPGPGWPYPARSITLSLGTRVYLDPPAAPSAEARDAWTLMQDGAPEPDTDCAVLLRYTLDRPPFLGLDRWEMHREDPTGMGGPAMDMGYGWRDNFDCDVIAWAPIPSHAKALAAHGGAVDAAGAGVV